MDQAEDRLSSSTEFDSAFEAVSDLTWLPWVGSLFGSRPQDQRLLVVGESHYAFGDSQEQFAKVIQDHIAYKPHTRDMVWDLLVNQPKKNRTLNALPKLLFGTSAINHRRVWSDTAYYNFVQRPMYFNRKGGPERPTWNDFVFGWRLFSDLIQILRPSHCVFIGVTASNSFDYAMGTLGHAHTAVRRTERISKTHGRIAQLTIEGHTTDIAFVQHLGKFFSWSKWHNSLRSHHPALTTWLDAQRYGAI